MVSDLPIAELAKKLRSGELTSGDIITECYDHLETWNPQINAAITIVPKEEALTKAAQVDSIIPNTDSLLAGIPYVMKDAYVTHGVRTTAGSKILDTFIPVYSATVHSKLEQAGAVLIGKMNMDAWGH